jgi:hypothetical protein
MFILSLLIILANRLFVTKLPREPLEDTFKIQRVLDAQKIEFSNYSYYELLGLMRDKGEQPHIYTIREHGVKYKIEVSSYWLNEYQKDGDLIVYFTIYNQYLSAQNPLRATIIKRKGR